MLKLVPFIRDIVGSIKKKRGVAELLACHCRICLFFFLRYLYLWGNIAYLVQLLSLRTNQSRKELKGSSLICRVRGLDKVKQSNIAFLEPLRRKRNDVVQPSAGVERVGELGTSQNAVETGRDK